MDAGKDKSIDPQSEPQRTDEAPPEELPWDECLDDVTLPPGGETRRIWSDTGMAPAGHWPESGYVTAQGRDLRLDLLRGVFLVSMVIDHVRGPSPLYLLTGGNRFYTSAVEGFILTSGLVTGLAYQNLIRKGNLGASLLKILQRAFALYLLTAGLTLILLPLSEVLGLPWAQGVDLSHPLRLVVSILTLHRTYYLADVLLLYTVCFAFAPLAFVFLYNGMTWPVLGASWLLWLLWQLFPEFARLPWSIAGNYRMAFSAWQVLFFTGLVIGYHHDRIPALGRRITRWSLVITGLATAMLITFYFVFSPPTSAMPGELAIGSPIAHTVRLWLDQYVFAKADLRLGRLLASAVAFTFLFLFITFFWRHVRRLLGWLLLPLGRHAIYAYTAHTLVVGVAGIVAAKVGLAFPGPQWLNAILQIACILLVWLLVRWQVLLPTRRTRRLWYAFPFVIAILVVLLLPSIARPAGSATGATAGPAALSERTARRFGTPIAPPTPTPQTTPTPLEPESRLAPYRVDLQGAILEHYFYSPELDREMPYILYLPPDYNTADRRYPVLYMLHGRGGHRDEWLSYGLLNIADEMIASGEIPPLIIVLAQGDKGYWANHTNEGPRWGEYIDRDLVTHIDGAYRTLPNPGQRAIGGLSMGGWGALHHAFLHPDIFGVVGAHSPSLRPDDGSLDFLGRGSEFALQDPIQLAQTMPDLGKLQIWVDTAEKDPWVSRAYLLDTILDGRGIQHIHQVYPGEHDYLYWTEHSADYLRYYGYALARQ